MPIIDLFSKRRKEAMAAGKPVVYQYDQFPTPFRVQVSHIWSTAIGPWASRYSSAEIPASNMYWSLIENLCARELGRRLLGEASDPMSRCVEFLETAKRDELLDIVELSFRFIDKTVRLLDNYQRHRCRITQDSDEAIEELNHRFREHGLGYQYADGQIVRVDSQLLHVEGVDRAITLLHDLSFDGPNREFLTAHEHYRHGRHKEAIVEANKALESTLKAICDKRSWAYPHDASAKRLLEIAFKNGLIPPFLEAHLSALRSTLESGLPTTRNRTAGHGQGATPVDVPAYLVSYALHLSAVSIVLLAEAHKES